MKLLKIIKKNDYNAEYIGKELQEFYDVVINIKSIASLSNGEGWPIKWNIKRIEEYNNFKTKNLLKIGVLGNGNVGKSFLLSRLFKKFTIPSGYSVVTEGLSLKYNEKDGYTILDSAGIGTPLLTEEELYRDKDEENRQKYESIFRDKSQTENFIQNLIIDLCDMMLIVVGHLTFREQKLINKIVKEIQSKSNKKTSQIYIIHNLVHFLTKKQVEEYIENTLFKSATFNLKINQYVQSNGDVEEGRQILVEKDDDRNIKIFHLIMAKEETEAGNYYNDFTYKVLNDHFSHFTERTPLSIVEEVKNKFVEWSNDLLEEKINSENLEIVKGENNIEEKIIYKKSEKDNEIKIIPKGCIDDESGLNIYRSNGFEPSYYYYIENDEYLVVDLEAAGEIQIEENYADSNLKEVIIIGTKIDNVTNKKPIRNTTKVGKFNLHIKYINDINIADENPLEGDTNEKGLYQMKFKLVKKRKVVKKDNK